MCNVSELFIQYPLSFSGCIPSMSSMHSCVFLTKEYFYFINSKFLFLCACVILNNGRKGNMKKPKINKGGEVINL